MTPTTTNELDHADSSTARAALGLPRIYPGPENGIHMARPSTGPDGTDATTSTPVGAPEQAGENNPNGVPAPTTPDAAPQPDATPDADPEPGPAVDKSDEDATDSDGDSESDPAAVPGPQAATDRPERLRLAREEDKALKAAHRDGLPIPPTPNLDQLHKEYDMRPAGTAKKTAGTTRTKEAPVAPAARRGWTFIPLRSDKHVSTITAAIKGKGLESTVVGLFFEVKNGEAQQLVAAIGDYATANRKAIYDARLAVATLVMLRREFPKVTDEKAGATNKAVSGLNAAKESGKIDDWSVSIKLDGTLSWTVTTKGKGADLGAREVAAKYAA